MYILSDLNLRFLSDKSDFVCFRGKKIKKVTLIQKDSKSDSNSRTDLKRNACALFAALNRIELKIPTHFAFD